MNILHFLFPPKCIGCQEILLPESRGEASLGSLCDECRGKLLVVGEPNCPVCGREIINRCETCRGEVFFYEKHTSVFYYESSVKPMIYRFKYGRKASYGKALGDLMYEYALKKNGRLFEGIDCIVPVPLHQKRLRKRGFNQAALLARQLSKRTGIPAIEALERKRNTKAQSSLSSQGRQENIKDAFVLGKKIDVSLKKILLLDDIHTTGNTLNACAKVLVEAGAKRPDCLTLSMAGKPVRTN